MIEAVFWLSLFLIVYPYVLYPAVVALLHPFLSKPVAKKPHTPRTSLVIAAYNEQKSIRAKIENSLQLEYPAGQLEIIVASDCSSDATDAIVREYAGAGVKLARLPRRQGKFAAQLNAVAMATGDPVVFSDAPTLYRPSAVRNLVRNFADDAVGIVTGDVIYSNESGSVIGEGETDYARYELWLRRMESDIGSVMNVAGCIWAIRKGLFQSLAETADVGDLIAVQAYMRGVRCVMEPEAVCVDKTTDNIRDEFRMRTRVVSRGLRGLADSRAIFNPFRYPQHAFELVSHKLLRYLVPVFGIVFVISNLLLLPASLHVAILALQVAVCGLALVGWVLEHAGARKIRLFFVPYSFLVNNLACLVGLYRFLMGSRDRTWTPAR